MDADGQHDPQDIPRLIEKIEQGYDLVVGARQKAHKLVLVVVLPMHFTTILQRI